MLNYFLIIILIISLITDLRERKILNIVTLPAIGFGPVYHLTTNGWEGFLFSGNGLLLGFALLYIPFLLGGMGAGDVKLLAAIGSIKGVTFVFYSFIYTCLFGGLIALFILIYKRQLSHSVQRISHAFIYRQPGFLSRDEIQFGFPYGVAIVCGTLTTYLWGGIA